MSVEINYLVSVYHTIKSLLFISSFTFGVLSVVMLCEMEGKTFILSSIITVLCMLLLLFAPPDEIIIKLVTN